MIILLKVVRGNH